MCQDSRDRSKLGSDLKENHGETPVKSEEEPTGIVTATLREEVTIAEAARRVSMTCRWILVQWSMATLSPKPMKVTPNRRSRVLP